jgi:hypothetical protein
MPKSCSKLGNLRKLKVIANMQWDYLQGSMTKEADQAKFEQRAVGFVGKGCVLVYIEPCVVWNSALL